MKYIKLISLLLMMLLPTAVIAQEKVLVLDEASFAPIQTDALTGLNIDPIGKDRSQRACARLKIHIDRMTREEINDIQVIPMGGNVQLTERIVAIEGNGLIVEMTARPVTIYLKHPTLGESNPIKVNLEDNKEYRLEAWCNQLQSITIYCPKPGAEVYLDGEYKGTISADNKLGVRDVVPGDHTLKVQAGEDVAEEQINVSSHNFSFNVELKSAALSQAYIVFNVKQKDALIKLDGEILLSSDGQSSKLVKFGNHTYEISAANYHTQMGTILIEKRTEVPIDLQPAFGWLNIESEITKGATIYLDNKNLGTAPIEKSEAIPSGEYTLYIKKPLYKDYTQKVTIEDGKLTTLQPILEANFNTVTLKTIQGAEIWIDGKYKGTTIWSGDLEVASHIVECKKESHKSTKEPLYVTLDMTNKNIVLQSPSPIYGILDVKPDSTSQGATLYVDGQNKGVLPQYLPQTLIGERKIKVSKVGYEDYEQRVTIAENEKTSLTVSLSKQTRRSSSSSSYSSSSSSSSSYSSSSYRSKRSKRTLYPDEMFQLGFGAEMEMAKKVYTVNIPVELRIGNIENSVNFILGENFSIRRGFLFDSNSSSTDNYPKLASMQYRTHALLRFNFTFKYNDVRPYFALGGSVNVNKSSDDIGGELVINKINYSTQLAFGVGSNRWDLSIYGIYDVKPLYNKDLLDAASLEMDEYKIINEQVSNRLRFGISIKVYLFGVD